MLVQCKARRWYHRWGVLVHAAPPTPMLSRESLSALALSFVSKACQHAYLGHTSTLLACRLQLGAMDGMQRASSASLPADWVPIIRCGLVNPAPDVRERLHASSSFLIRIKYAFATSYALQQIAVLGAAVTTRAFIPLKNPFAPSLLHIIPAPWKSPRACLISRSELAPLVCNNVLITSSGVVAAAANPPASPPAVQCIKGS